MTDAQLFETPFGTSGIVWRDGAVSGFQLPAPRDVVARRLREMAGVGSLEGKAPRWIQSLEKRISRHLEGRPDPLIDIPLDLSGMSQFRRRISEEARGIPPGTTATYGDLAARCGSPGAARAVGQTMARNPIPLLVPCHRVVGANGALTGFSGPGELGAKLRLLTVEGAALAPLAQAGVRYLRRVDPRLGRLIRNVGRYELAWMQRTDPFTALAESIVHQQVSMAAGRTIYGRLLKRAGKGDTLSPRRILNLPPEAARAVGLSRQKASYLKDLAERTVSRAIPLARLERMDDEKVIEALTEVKGIGRWSAQMYLMFRLGRLDVLPEGDLGLQKGVKLVYGLPELPSPAELRDLGAKWTPYRSIGTWYMWRGIETGGI